MERVDSSLQAGSPGLAMTPLQALTTGFVVGTGNGVVQSRTETRSEAQAQHLALGEPRLGFHVGECRLMVRHEDCSELSEMGTIHRLPNAPIWFCGMVNLHGKLMPVFDLARFIGVAGAAGAKRKLLVLAHGSDAAGILIDGMPERLRWLGEKHNGLQVAPRQILQHLRGASRIDGELWFDLDVDSLLTEIEQSVGMA